ncbi:MAG TPA: succinate dehydrogenase/fumarate reductase cytochrome b subunit [Porphyromonadaceae bacterium]|uniref:succinate dehydrogenase cytochrome b subunit n=1 Tax=Limibacterium fermenti TaxID=3229863 RepID=UPI000E7DDAEC|nr:succinate dehydrogenase/fumarate reductase cytochrome b subunit [Porphyromonadaceae bacterium]HBL33502.1 succinate dehydrogenase/fumarate reductase cytochrome b subunit [Porphyromonadaceae bacterium]HBX19585.1 succinate dehydrogenase/fumarate reductase cytochrome b subunit [Porphyromonadaceae bacterium]HBX45286.1 succinate dehydrogenase/fumarate reductase cytochrome b subunit [Porphyromonadaceae bacterium]HCM19320.1 succinate dehydrogenase/fumarate reductase cytochrome b subunit [Porphyromon
MSWLVKSSIGRKFIMSISGLFLILFLLFHMSMNLVLVFSLDAYDMICRFLGANWYAIVGTLVLAAGFIVHIIYATLLTLQNRKARGNDRYATANKSTATWSSKNMYVLGIAVLAFLVLHMMQFWYKMQFKEIVGDHTAIVEGSLLVVPFFQNPVNVVIYLIAFVALWFHLTHGFWSALQTVGLNNTVWMKRLKVIGNIVATIICAGFAFTAVYLYFAY